MIKVTASFTKRNEIKALIVSGHANYAKYGQDIVCAGVSSLVIAIANQIKRHNLQCEIITNDNEDGYVAFEVSKSNDKLNLLLETLIMGLKEIESSYPKYIKIKEVDYA